MDGGERSYFFFFSEIIKIICLNLFLKSLRHFPKFILKILNHFLNLNIVTHTLVSLNHINRSHIDGRKERVSARTLAPKGSGSLEVNPERESPKRTISVSGGFRP